MLRCEVGERAAAVRDERRPVAAAARRQHGGSPLWPATRCLYLSPPLAVWALIVAVPLSLSSLLRRYYARMTMDFQTNKRVCEEVALIPSKALKNKIAGYATHLMKRIQRGPVRGISLKLQEEERERRMDFVPDVSAVDTDIIDVSARSEERTRAGAARTLGGGADAKGRQGDNYTQRRQRRTCGALPPPLCYARSPRLSRARRRCCAHACCSSSSSLFSPLPLASRSLLADRSGDQGHASLARHGLAAWHRGAAGVQPGLEVGGRPRRQGRRPALKAPSAGDQGAAQRARRSQSVLCQSLVFVCGCRLCVGRGAPPDERRGRWAMAEDRNKNIRKHVLSRDIPQTINAHKDGAQRTTSTSTTPTRGREPARADRRGRGHIFDYGPVPPR